MIPKGDCWIWKGHRASNGYGRYYVKALHGEVMAHRIVYEMLVGPIPTGLQLDHLCRQRGCVNPAHLRPVTQMENALAPGSKAHVAKTHCKRGHPFNEANTYRQSNGSRECRECKRITRRQRERHA